MKPTSPTILTPERPYPPSPEALEEIIESRNRRVRVVDVAIQHFEEFTQSRFPMDQDFREALALRIIDDLDSHESEMAVQRSVADYMDEQRSLDSLRAAELFHVLRRKSIAHELRAFVPEMSRQWDELRDILNRLGVGSMAR